MTRLDQLVAAAAASEDDAARAALADWLQQHGREAGDAAVVRGLRDPDSGPRLVSRTRELAREYAVPVGAAALRFAGLLGTSPGVSGPAFSGDPAGPEAPVPSWVDAHEAGAGPDLSPDTVDLPPVVGGFTPRPDGPTRLRLVLEFGAGCFTLGVPALVAGGAAGWYAGAAVPALVVAVCVFLLTLEVVNCRS